METEIRLVGSITIDITFEAIPKFTGASRMLLAVNRTIKVDGKKIYEDRMSPQMYLASKDPIRNLEKFILGLEKTESGKDIGSDSGNRRNFFKQIWRKLFGKQVKFVT